MLSVYMLGINHVQTFYLYPQSSVGSYLISACPPSYSSDIESSSSSTVGILCDLSPDTARVLRDSVSHLCLRRCVATSISLLSHRVQVWYKNPHCWECWRDFGDSALPSKLREASRACITELR